MVNKNILELGVDFHSAALEEEFGVEEVAKITFSDEGIVFPSAEMEAYFNNLLDNADYGEEVVSVNTISGTQEEDEEFINALKAMGEDDEKLEHIALFDMDGTLCNYEGALLRDLKSIAGPNDPPIEAIYGDLPDWLEARIRLIRKQPKWWKKLEQLPIGMQIFQKCVDIGFDIRILTKGPRRTLTAWTEKAAWCHCNLLDIAPDMQVTVTEDKGLTYGKVLVDDFPAYMDRWLKWRPRGLGVMPAQPWNEGYSHPNVIRYTGNMDELSERLQQAFDR